MKVLENSNFFKNRPFFLSTVAEYVLPDREFYFTFLLELMKVVKAFSKIYYRAAKNVWELKAFCSIFHLTLGQDINSCSKHVSIDILFIVSKQKS